MRRMKRTKIQKWRLWLSLAGAVLVAVGWPLSVYVAELNAQRFDSPDAQKLFNPLHGVSLMGSALTRSRASFIAEKRGSLFMRVLSPSLEPLMVIASQFVVKHRAPL